MDQLRRWDELDSKCLMNVFGRVGMESVLLDVAFVCKSWYKVSLNPSCWLILDFPDVVLDPFSEEIGRDPFQVDVHSKPQTYGPFYDRFAHEYEIGKTRFSLASFVKLVVNRSSCNTTGLKLPLGLCTASALEYFSDVCPGLKFITLPGNLKFSKHTHIGQETIPKLIGKWKNLEALTLGTRFCNLEKILAQISIHCHNFVSLRVINFYFRQVDVSAIVNLMPAIKYLRLTKCFIERHGVVKLLLGCKELVVFDIQKCDGFKVDHEIFKLASHIPKFTCESCVDVSKSPVKSLLSIGRFFTKEFR